MSKIIYKPHCEKCGTLLDQKVQYTRHAFEVNNDIPRVHDTTYYEFRPYRCKNCGATFDSAEIQPPEEVLQFLD